MRLAFLCLLVSAVFPPVSRAQALVFEITPIHRWIKFDVKASVDIAGRFDKWNATLTNMQAIATNRQDIANQPGTTLRFTYARVSTNW